MKTKTTAMTRVQTGFSLIELLIVVVLLGVFLTFFANNLLGTTAGAKAKTLIKTAESIGQNLNLLAQTCGVSTTVASNPLATTGKTVADVLFVGKTAVSATYTGCYDQSNLRALSNAAAVDGTNYRIENFPVTLTGGGTAPLRVAYDRVPDEVVLSMAQRYNATLTTLAASDTTAAVVQYGTVAADGTRTASVLVQ